IGLNDGTGGSGHYLSLNNSGTSPTASSTVATDNIVTKPATGQIYRFTPAAMPTVASFSPASACGSGTSVTITGTNFVPCLSGVSFNGTAAITFAYVNATTITATVPAGATSGPVSITTPGGTGSSGALSFTINTSPSITSQPAPLQTVCIGSSVTFSVIA